MKKLFIPLILVLFYFPLPAIAGGNTFDPVTSILTMPLVKTPAATFTDLEVKILDYRVIKAHQVVEIEMDPDEPIFDGDPGGIGILPNGHTCFIGVTPGCKPSTAWDHFDPFPDWGDPGPSDPSCEGFSPPDTDCE